jgi:hypothetical protein
MEVSMQKHMKLSDVEAATNYLLPRVPTTFEKAYPMVESIRVEVRPSGEGFEPFRNETERLDVYNEKSIPAIINCRNPRCYGGGLNLDYLIRWAVVESKQTEYEAYKSCGGYEGSPKGRRKGDPCDTRFRVKVDVTYRKETHEGSDRKL